MSHPIRDLVLRPRPVTISRPLRWVWSCVLAGRHAWRDSATGYSRICLHCGVVQGDRIQLPPERVAQAAVRR